MTTLKEFLKTKPNETDQLNEALELMLELAFQNIVDRLDNPGEYRRQMAAHKLVRDTFLPGSWR